MKQFSKVLVANRGEIACRIARTTRALGYRTVAVFSDVDVNSPHIAMADEAVAIGGSTAAESYLVIDKIIDAARRTGADAIHPGCGFLSENGTFAEACAEAGIVFIGPSAEAIRVMGDKAAAKRQMIAADVPCVPGYQGEAQTDETFIREASSIGFPVMVKAANGGGGKGMRLVTQPERLIPALAAARSEALQAFGSADLLLEKAIANPKHIELQIFADVHGNVCHLFERDCSIQRRHQKVIEEAPSAILSKALREEMGECAAMAARAINYVGAGTIEFLLAPDGAYYFLEMNTRLQVEHPVTEMITGLDLVEWQLRVAAGEELPLRQEQIGSSGHAIEARLYAESSHDGFLPQTGTVVSWEPPDRNGIRVDHGLTAGQSISSYYDPLLAKIIGYGTTREEAARRLVAALEETVILGIETNRRFLIDCLAHPEFRSGRFTTGFIEQHFKQDQLKRAAPPPSVAALAAVLMGRGGKSNVSSMGGASGSWPVHLRHNDETSRLDLKPLADGSYEASVGGEQSSIALVSVEPPRLRFLANSVIKSAHFAWFNTTLFLTVDAVTYQFEDAFAFPSARGASANGNAALSPMSGTVTMVCVKPGDAVLKGQALVVVEAMKMQHEVIAPRDGVIDKVLVALNEQVAARKLLVELAAEAAQGAGRA
jgi:geranyl-CoA carboxylase alpha subunit